MATLATLWMHRAEAMHGIIPSSTYCDGQGLEATGEGPATQLDIHTDVFKPAFASACETAAQPSYLGTGDRAGILKLMDRARDFAASDVPLSTAEKLQLENDLKMVRGRISPINQLPLYVDGLAIGYNLGCLPTSKRLDLSSENLSLIYSGQIKRWNDMLLVRDNPALASCLTNISLVKRSGYAGSTTIFKDYLSKRNPQWNHYKAPERNTEWPTSSFSCSGTNDVEMADCINTTDGTLGYLQFHTAKVYGVRLAAADNATSRFLPNPDRFILPSPQNCKKAAETIVLAPAGGRVDNPILYGQAFELPPASQQDWSTVSLTDSYDGYPICNLGYIFVFGKWNAAYAAQNSPGNLRTIADYLWTAASDTTQASLLANDYAPLPPAILKAVREGIESLRLF